MRTFLIDLENVKNQGLSGIDQLDASDRVFIYYSENANTLNIPTIQMMNRSKAQIDYVHLQHSGHNAMDFQIVALLGFLIGSEREGQFCIVSQDRGYLAPVEFFMDHAAGSLDVHVLLSPSIQKAVNRWNQMSREKNQNKVVLADPEAPVVESQPEEEEPEVEETPVSEPEVVFEPADVPAEKTEQPAFEAPATEEKAVTPEPEKKPEEEKPAKKANTRSRRTRKSSGRKETEKAEVTEEKKPEESKPEEQPETVKPEEKAEVPAVSEKKEEAAAEEKKPANSDNQAAAEKPAEKKNGRNNRKTGRKNKPEAAEKPQEKPEQAAAEKPQEPAAKPQMKPVVVSKAFQQKIGEVLEGVVDEEFRGKYDRLIGEAILATDTKNEFYQYFRRTLGAAQGGNLYHAVRGEYERLNKALEETLS